MSKFNFRSLIPSVLALAVGITASVKAQAQPADQWGGPLERSDVFSPGDYNSKFYRIPALATMKDGNIIAVADKRIEHMGDLPAKIDVVCRISEDNGKTWGEYITIAEHDSIGGYGDPAVVVDQKTGDVIVISTHGNGLWQKEPGHISISRSQDNGKTWLPAVDINPQILTMDPEGPQPIKCVSAFASSGAALQLKDGRLMFALVVREPGNKQFKCYAVYSDDGGYNWTSSTMPGTLDGDESKVVELADGTIIMSIRNRYREGRYNNNRIFAYSKDRGLTWSEPEAVEGLIDPACNGDILRYTCDGKDILLQSIPDSPNQRENVTIFASMDNGKTWPIKRLIVPGTSAYSAMTVLPDGSIGILTEEGCVGENPHKEYFLRFTRVPLEYILEGE